MKQGGGKGPKYESILGTENLNVLCISHDNINDKIINIRVKKEVYTFENLINTYTTERDSLVWIPKKDVASCDKPGGAACGL